MFAIFYALGVVVEDVKIDPGHQRVAHGAFVDVPARGFRLDVVPRAYRP